MSLYNLKLDINKKIYLSFSASYFLLQKLLFTFFDIIYRLKDLTEIIQRVWLFMLGISSFIWLRSLLDD